MGCRATRELQPLKGAARRWWALLALRAASPEHEKKTKFLNHPQPCTPAGATRRRNVTATQAPCGPHTGCEPLSPTQPPRSHHAVTTQAQRSQRTEGRKLRRPQLRAHQEDVVLVADGAFLQAFAALRSSPHCAKHLCCRSRDCTDMNVTACKPTPKGSLRSPRCSSSPLEPQRRALRCAFS